MSDSLWLLRIDLLARSKVNVLPRASLVGLDMTFLWSPLSSLSKPLMLASYESIERPDPFFAGFVRLPDEPHND